MNNKNKSGWIDVSTAIHNELPVWPGDPKPRVVRTASLENGDEYNLTEIAMSLHTGTHLDAPAHYLPGGKSIDDIDPSATLGRARVFQIDNKRIIGKADLEGVALAPGDKLLLKTDNSRQDWTRSPFKSEYSCINLQAAEYLAERKISLVGIDYLSIGDDSEGAGVHRALLKSNILILEGLILKNVDPGEYELLCLPLKVAGADGSPARVFLKKIIK